MRSILGITFGTVYGTALSYLLNNGYAIDGYADGTIYLSDVTLLGAGWPLATLYCNGTGGLTSAQFSYYTGYNSMARYDQVYRLLCGTYGTPLSLTANGIARRGTFPPHSFSVYYKRKKMSIAPKKNVCFFLALQE